MSIGFEVITAVVMKTELGSYTMKRFGNQLTCQVNMSVDSQRATPRVMSLKAEPCK
jgi:hypothetical protein